MKVVKQIEGTRTGANDKPVQDVVIANSGVLPVEQPFSVDKAPSSLD